MAVTVKTIADALARPTPTGPMAAQWSGWIDEAVYLIQSRYGDAFASIPALDLDYVVKQAVVEHVRLWRPEAAERVEVAVDDGRMARTYRRDAGALTIDDALWGRLDDALGLAEQPTGAFTIDPCYVRG